MSSVPVRTSAVPRPAVRTLIGGVLAVVALALLLTGPGYLSRYQLDVGFTLLVYVGMAQAWNVLAGLGGQVSLATSGFVGIGAYASALLVINAGASLIVAVLAAAGICAGIALLLSVPLFRLRAAYFTVGTLALVLSVQAAVVNWPYAGGSQGLSFPFESVPSQEALYLYAAVLAAVATLLAWAIRRSDFGLRLMAVRDNEGAAGTLGVAAFRVKLAAFMLTSALTGVAGALIAVRQVSIEPTSVFSLTWTINVVVMTVVGGIGSLSGPIIGVLVVYYGIQTQLESSPALSALLTGILLVTVVRFAPEGLRGVLAAGGRRAWGSLRRSS